MLFTFSLKCSAVIFYIAVDILDEQFKALFSFLIAWNSHKLILVQLFFLFMLFRRASYEVKNP